MADNSNHQSPNHLLGIEGMQRGDIEAVLNLANDYAGKVRNGEKVDAVLDGLDHDKSVF